MDGCTRSPRSRRRGRVCAGGAAGSTMAYDGLFDGEEGRLSNCKGRREDSQTARYSSSSSASKTNEGPLDSLHVSVCDCSGVTRRSTRASRDSLNVTPQLPLGAWKGHPSPKSLDCTASFAHVALEGPVLLKWTPRAPPPLSASVPRSRNFSPAGSVRGKLHSGGRLEASSVEPSRLCGRRGPGCH